MNSNIIICTYGVSVGGMEVLFANYANYLVNKGYNVLFITQESGDNIYEKLLIGEKKIKFVKVNTDILNMSDSERRKVREQALDQLGDLNWDNTFAVCGYFVHVLLLENILKGKNVPITHIWAHPLEWVRYAYLNPLKYHFDRRKVNSVYKYQKKLIEIMDAKNAMYYTSYAIFNYNKWYFDAALKERKIEGLPIQINTGEPFSYSYSKKGDSFNILWVGRFDYFKNDAIIYILKTLEKLVDETKVRITFNVVGKGRPQFEKDIKNRLKSELVTVNLQGPVPPDHLNDVFEKNDVGIAMGVTVKQMGYSGLPAILIDSMNDSYKEDKCCNWVFDIETGDDGDGMYYKTIGKPLEYRNSLYNILMEVIANPIVLDDYSEKCKKSVSVHYSYEGQYEIITERVLHSEFTGDGYPIYRNSLLRRSWRKFKKTLLLLKKSVTR